MIAYIVDFKNKSLNLIKYFIYKYFSAHFYIDRIEQLASGKDYLVYFVGTDNMQTYTKNVREIFATPKILNKFSNKDAAKIGFYCAKSLLGKESL